MFSKIYEALSYVCFYCSYDAEGRTVHIDQTFIIFINYFILFTLFQNLVFVEGAWVSRDLFLSCMTSYLNHANRRWSRIRIIRTLGSRQSTKLIFWQRSVRLIFIHFKATLIRNFIARIYQSQTGSSLSLARKSVSKNKKQVSVSGRGMTSIC